MNTLGKILVVLIFIMSIFFMAFSFMVFMTHNSWKDKSDAAKSSLNTAQQNNRALEAEIATIKKKRMAENAARVNAIALLEGRLRTSSEQLTVKNQQVLALRSDQAQKGEQVTGSLEALEIERNKVETLRKSVNSAQAERDKMFDEVVKLKDQVLEYEAVRARLASRNDELLDQLVSADAVLEAYDTDRNEDISGVAPRLSGSVTQVQTNNKYVALTLGSDDGMRRGHKLDVHRGAQYIARVEITKTHPDRSVAVVLDDYRKGAIRSGDSVRTK